MGELYEQLDDTTITEDTQYMTAVVDALALLGRLRALNQVRNRTRHDREIAKWVAAGYDARELREALETGFTLRQCGESLEVHQRGMISRNLWKLRKQG